MNLPDVALLARKILIGIIITLIPFLIIWGGLQLVPKVFKPAVSHPRSSNQSK